MNEEIYLKWLKKTSNLELLIRASRRYFGVEEEWKDVVGWEGLYSVSNFGRIESCRSKKIRALRFDKKGYLRVNLSIHQDCKTPHVHVMVTTAFFSNPENKETSNHKNGIKWDNRAVNLEWNTYSENITHAYRVLGKRNHTAIRVNQLDLNGNFIKKWDTIKEAYTSLGLNEMCITNYLKGRVKNPKTFRWEVVD